MKIFHDIEIMPMIFDTENINKNRIIYVFKNNRRMGNFYSLGENYDK